MNKFEEIEAKTEANKLLNKEINHWRVLGEDEEIGKKRKKNLSNLIKMKS